MIIEYVMSATGHARLGAAHKLMDVVDTSYLRDILNTAQDLDGVHKISMLYNAYTEKKVGHQINDLFGDSVYKVHVDSGGLQIVNLGLENTPALRKAVYENQAESGDIGMCFDEIPLHNEAKGGGAARINTKDKVFMYDLAFAYGAKTGKNIRAQIETYIETGSDCKPYIILQGNSEADFIAFSDGIMSELKGVEHYIAGCAAADTCIGNGVRESIDMMSVIRKLNIPERAKKSVHMLGVGSVKRMLPAVALMRSGYFGDDFHISYDSSTHTGCLTNREYTNKVGARKKISGHGIMRNGIKQPSRELDEMLDEVHGRFGECLPRSKEEFKEFATRLWLKELNKETMTDEDIVFEVACNLCIILSQVNNFQAIISETFDLNTPKATDLSAFFGAAVEDKQPQEGFKKWSSIRRLDVLDKLLEVNTIDGYERWHTSYVDRLPSMRIRRGLTTDYPDFKVQ